MKAAANASRPTSGVGGERNSHQSSIVFHQVPETGLLPAAAIQATSSASPASSDARITTERPRLNHHASRVAVTRTAYGPAVRRPASEAGSGGSSATAGAVTAMIATGTQAGRSTE